MVHNGTNTTKGDMLSLISDSIPMYDELCRRFLNFVFSCMNCGSELVSFFVRFGVHQACMKSPLGRNYVSAQFDLASQLLILESIKRKRKRKRYVLSSSIVCEVCSICG